MLILQAVSLTEQFWGYSPARINAFIWSPQLMISRILPNIYAAASIILLIYAVFGGFLYITSAGNQEQAGKGSKIITNAVIGFLIIFASYWIIQAIQVITGIPIVSGA